MIVGDTYKFAIESSICEAYEKPNLFALGMFLIHIAGKSYGVREADASLLACSFDEVSARIRRRGKHRAFFSSHPNAGEIADAFRSAFWNLHEPAKTFFGLTSAEIKETIYRNDICWAPDGDEAFDDGSFVLQFDLDERVRLIGFRCNESNQHDPKSISDQLLSSSEYYTTLELWRRDFEDTWRAAPKVDVDGTSMEK